MILENIISLTAMFLKIILFLFRITYNYIKFVIFNKHNEQSKLYRHHSIDFAEESGNFCRL